MTINKFNAQELCSRKLWEIVNNAPGTEQDIKASELKEAINELAERRHYLAELTDIGKAGNPN